LLSPPQMIISRPVHTAEGFTRALGAPATLMAVQVFEIGSYEPPVFVKVPLLEVPPQTIIREPVHTALCNSRGVGAATVDVAVHVSVAGLYRPPELVSELPVVPIPPQMIISDPVQTAVWPERAVGALVVVVGAQVSCAVAKEGQANARRKASSGRTCAFIMMRPALGKFRNKYNHDRAVGL